MMFDTSLMNMRLKSIRIILIILILLGIFNPNKNISNLDAFQDLPKFIEEAPYLVSDYKVNIFDCSNMSALLNDYLRNNGFNCSIVLVNDGSNKDIDHAFVECGDYYIEATEKRILSPEEKIKYESFLIKLKYNGNSDFLKNIWSINFGIKSAIQEWSY